MSDKLREAATQLIGCLDDTNPITDGGVHSWFKAIRDGRAALADRASDDLVGA